MSKYCDVSCEHNPCTNFMPTTENVRERYSDWYDGPIEVSIDIADAEFDRWLKQVKAKAWAEGFDAGERDVWEHQHGEAGEDWDKDCIPNPYIEEEKSVDDAVEKGYRLLAEDPEMSLRRQSHHCGFDFLENQATAKCECGVVSTNPFWTFKGEK